jgi:hypothetical protein
MGASLSASSEERGRNFPCLWKKLRMPLPCCRLFWNERTPYLVRTTHVPFDAWPRPARRSGPVAANCDASPIPDIRDEIA